MSIEMETISISVPSKHAAWYRRVMQSVQCQDDVGIGCVATAYIAGDGTHKYVQAACIAGSLTEAGEPMKGHSVLEAAAAYGAAVAIANARLQRAMKGNPDSAELIHEAFLSGLRTIISSPMGFGNSANDALASLPPSAFGIGGKQ